MKTTKLHQDKIADEFDDLIITATHILEHECEGGYCAGDDTTLNKTFYEITLVENKHDIPYEFNIAAFNKYLKHNFGIKKDRFYFEHPSQAFSALMKAWYIWNNLLPAEIKNGYIENEVKFYNNYPHLYSNPDSV